MEYVPTARPGARAPHAWIAPGQSTLDLFGRGFTLLDFGAKPADSAALVQAAASRGVPLTHVKLAHETAAGLYQAPLVLVRPDGHVAWRADRAPSDAAALMDTASGRASGAAA